MTYSVRAERYYGPNSYFCIPTNMLRGIDPNAETALDQVVAALAVAVPTTTDVAELRRDVVAPIMHRRRQVAAGGVLFHSQDFMVFFSDTTH